MTAPSAAHASPTYQMRADARKGRASASGGGCLPREGSSSRRGSKVARKETPSLQVWERPVLASGLRLQWQQLAALTRKNLIIRRRAWKTNVLLVAQAVLFISLIFVVDKAVSASRQRQPAFSRVEQAAAAAVGPVPDCANNLFMRAGLPCLTFLYAPSGDLAVEAVVRGVMERNEPPIPPSRVLGLANASAVDAWLLQHPETALAAVIFSPANASAPSGGGDVPLAAASAPWNGTGGAALPGAGTGALPAGVGADGYGTPPEQLAFADAPPASAQLAVAQLGFTVQTNSSVQWFKGSYQHPNTHIQLPLQVAVEREVARYLTGNPALSWSVSLAQFPHPSAKSPSMIGQFAPTFLFASIMFQFVLLVHDFVAEKEGRSRQMMATMGLRPAPFWASWVLLQGLLAAVEACLLVGFGNAFGFRLFTVNAFGLSFLLLLLVSLAMTAFGFFLAAFLSKASAAVPAGFLLFVVAWVVLCVIAFGWPYSPSNSVAAIAVFSAMPWSLLSKGVQDLADATSGRLPGIPWADRFAYCQPGRTLPPGAQLAGSYWQPDCTVPLGQMYWILAVQCVGFMVLALYLDAVLPDANGVRLPPWFFLMPGYWGRGASRRSQRAAVAALAAPTEAECGLAVDADVAAEAARQRAACAADLRSHSGGGRGLPAEAVLLPGAEASAAAASEGGGEAAAAAGGPADPARPFAVQMWGLRKVYQRGLLPWRRRPFVAVRGNWLGVHQGECFCLLGPNGAGKSTTINCCIGALPLDAGDARVCGESLAAAGGLGRIRPLMGVCPQFDALWAELTGREHLELFGAIKGLRAAVREGDAARLLEEVKLSEAAGVRAGAYSGGMKRRLSVAIALLGDPQVVYLDEPTTGLDPISRRHLWDLIDRAKRDRALVLTTHSMEEADVLGDRIGIMARGRLRCLGTSLRLKARFGSGYRVSVRVAGGGGGATSLAWAGAGAAAPAQAEAPVEEWGEIQPEPGVAAEAGEEAEAAAAAPVAGEARQRDPVAARQAAALRALFWRMLGIKPSDESLDYLHFLVPYDLQDRLPALFAHLKGHAATLGLADLQLRLTPLEEVFLSVARKAELEHAQLEGHHETLHLAEEGVAVKVPVGAELIQSPAGQLYHVVWGQDPDTGELKLQDYYRDAASAAAAAAGAAPDLGGETSDDAAGEA